MLFGLCSGKGRKSVSDEHSSIASAARQQTSPIGSPNGSPRAAAVIAAKGVNPSEASQVADEKILNGLLPGVILKTRGTASDPVTQKTYSYLSYKDAASDIENFKNVLTSQEISKIVCLCYVDNQLKTIALHPNQYKILKDNEITYFAKFDPRLNAPLISENKPEVRELSFENFNAYISKLLQEYKA